MPKVAAATSGFGLEEEEEKGGWGEGRGGMIPMFYEKRIPFFVFYFFWIVFYYVLVLGGAFV